MGIRLALGASRSGLLQLTVMQSVRLVLGGSVVGLAAAWFLDRFLASTLVDVRVLDPFSLTLSWALMAIIALMGTSFPALDASHTDLISVLRSE